MVKKKQKNIIKLTKQNCKNEHRRDIENYLMKKKLKKRQIEEIDTEISERR